MRHLCILGSTGSIGLNTLQVIRDHRERFKVIALTAHSNIEVLAGQCLEFQPAIAVVATETGATELRALIATNCPKTEILWGPHSLELVASHPEVDTVMAAIVDPGSWSRDDARRSAFFAVVLDGHSDVRGVHHHSIGVRDVLLRAVKNQLFGQCLAFGLNFSPSVVWRRGQSLLPNKNLLVLHNRQKILKRFLTLKRCSDRLKMLGHPIKSLVVKRPIGLYPILSPIILNWRCFNRC